MALFVLAVVAGYYEASETARNCLGSHLWLIAQIDI